MKSFFKVARIVTLFGQFGFTLITPPVIMAFLAWWLQDRFGLGAWVTMLGIVLGLITSGVTAYKFYLRVMKSEKRRAREEETTDKPVVFYTHE